MKKSVTPSRKENEFRLKPKAPRARQPRQSGGFVARLLVEINRAGGMPSPGKSTKARPTLSRIGRGNVAAAFAGDHVPANARRVIIKSRIVQLKRVTPGAVNAHLRYIARDGVSHDGQPSQPYGPEKDAADLHEFAEKGRNDRHQFRFIVAPEDAVELGDLRDYTRRLMWTMERDLMTRLDWVAVDHWDTDNPHTHIVLRGKTRHGEDLIIARRYMSEGMRLRACDIATRQLGIRSEHEITETLRRDVTQERWTRLDRELREIAGDGRKLDLARPGADLDALRHRNLLLGRLHELEKRGLASNQGKGIWQLSERHEPVLRVMGEQGDIIKAMNRALRGQARELAMRDLRNLKDKPVLGRIIGSGYVNELEDRGYVIVDGIDGRAHHLPIGPRDPTTLPLGAIVEVSASQPKAMDRHIAQMAGENGRYTRSSHRQALRELPEPRHDAEEVLEAYQRRLEALRRANVVERLADGIWRVPSDLPAKGFAYDRKQDGGITMRLHSDLSLDKQVNAMAPTWLDRTMISPGAEPAFVGFGADVRAALHKRAEFHIEHGTAEWKGDRLLLRRNVLAVLRQREMEGLAQGIAKQSGGKYRPLIDGQRTEGIYRTTVAGVSGRFAVLDDGLGFSLVPWRPAIEQSIGRHISAVVRGDYVSWSIGRDRGLSL